MREMAQGYVLLFYFSTWDHFFPRELSGTILDDWCTPDAVNGLDADLSAVATPVQIYRYDRSQHGFMNEARADVYDAEAAELAWDRALSFLGEHL